MLRVIQGNALDELAKLRTESVHCCVTSPPYWCASILCSNIEKCRGRTRASRRGNALAHQQNLRRGSIGATRSHFGIGIGCALNTSRKNAHAPRSLWTLASRIRLFNFGSKNTESSLGRQARLGQQNGGVPVENPTQCLEGGAFLIPTGAEGLRLCGRESIRAWSGRRSLKWFASETRCVGYAGRQRTPTFTTSTHFHNLRFSCWTSATSFCFALSAIINSEGRS